MTSDFKWAFILPNNLAVFPWIMYSCSLNMMISYYLLKPPVFVLLSYPLSSLSYNLSSHILKNQKQLQNNFHKLPSPHLTPVYMFFLPFNIGDISVILCVRCRFLLCRISHTFSTAQDLMAWVDIYLYKFLFTDILLPWITDSLSNFFTQYRYSNFIKKQFILIPLFLLQSTAILSTIFIS